MFHYTWPKSDGYRVTVEFEIWHSPTQKIILTLRYQKVGCYSIHCRLVDEHKIWCRCEISLQRTLFLFRTLFFCDFNHLNFTYIFLFFILESYCSRSKKGLFYPYVLAGPDVTLRWTITSRQGCDTLLHVTYALNFCEKFEAGPDIELLLYLRPDATIIV
jgi:hypothetical protein